MVSIALLILHLMLLHVGGIAARTVARPHWVIVMDAGSTKTEMNLFQLAPTSQGAWVPRQTLSEKWTMGLSEYDPNTNKDKTAVEQGFGKLLRKAEEIITDSNERAITPVFVYATAGLRALKKPRAEALLVLAKQAIKKSSFDKRFTNIGPERVTMISGAAEGIYAWLAVNYLLQPNLETQMADKDFGIVDLGGGSTQIAFRPDSEKLLEQANVALQSLTSPLGQEMKTKFGPGIYSKSFFDYGNSANIMKMVGAYEDCNSRRGCSEKVYESPCLPPNYLGSFEFGPHKFKIRNKLVSAKKRFDICRTQQKAVFKKYGVSPKNKMSPVRALLAGSDTVFFAVSAYFFASEHINRVHKLKSAGTTCDGFKMSVADFYQGARKVCESVTVSTNKYKTFSCFQTMYAATLLKDAYQRPDDTIIYACKKLKTQSGTPTLSVKASWALGVSFQAADTIFESSINTINRK